MNGTAFLYQPASDAGPAVICWYPHPDLSGNVSLQQRRRSAKPSTSTEPTDRRGYRIAEAADYMGVTPWFVELKIRSGELRALRMCRHYTILKEDMDAFLDEQWAA